MAACFRCKKELNLSGRPGRGEACPHCGSDVKVCLNCKFHDGNSYNECRETAAERVVDKDKANFCEYFEPGSGPAVREDALKGLNDLFKN